MVHLVPGTADGDIHTSFDIDPHFYRKTISILAEAGYRGSLTLEVMPEIPEEIILDGARYLRSTVAEVLYELG
jgi:sugar phosphate isomerase/epimerase